MNIGLAGPVRVRDLVPWLHADSRAAAQLAVDAGATPVTLLARELLRRGHRLVIVTLDHGVTTETVLKGPKLRICMQPLRARHRGRDAYRTERRLLEHSLQRESPPIVHAHWSYEYALAALATRLPTVITVRDWAPTILRWMPDPYRAVRLLMFIRATAAGRHFTTVSPYMASLVERWRRVSVPVIPNALDDEAFDPTPRKLHADAPVLLAINNGFTPWKNVRRLLAAYAQVRRRLPTSRLVLVGADHEPGGLAQQWATEHALTAGVEFVGRIPHAHVRDLLADADVLVHPSLEESFGMVLLEAMAQGLPVVAGDRSGAAPWVLDHGGAGVLTDVRSPRAMADAVTHLLDDPSRWASYSRAGYARATAAFRLAPVVDAYVQTYERVLAAEAPRHAPAAHSPRR